MIYDWIHIAQPYINSKDLYWNPEPATHVFWGELVLQTSHSISSSSHHMYPNHLFYTCRCGVQPTHNPLCLRLQHGAVQRPEHPGWDAVPAFSAQHQPGRHGRHRGGEPVPDRCPAGRRSGAVNINNGMQIFIQTLEFKWGRYKKNKNITLVNNPGGNIYSVLEQNIVKQFQFLTIGLKIQYLGKCA